MSKAFTKDEGEGSLGFDPEVDPLAALPFGSKNYMTISGYHRLHSEITSLLNQKAIASQPSPALERKIQILQRVLDLAEPVDPAQQSGDRVLFGATVTVVDEALVTHIYKIVGLTETRAKDGKISWLSPMGRALLQTRAGDVVTVQTPRGEEEFEVKKVEFKDID